MTFRKRLLRCLAATALWAGACTAAALAATLHPGDKIDVVVYYHPELSATVVVQSDGAVQLPVTGSIAVEGVSTATAARRIEERLRAYVPAAAVRVALDAQSDTIFVAGGPTGSIHYQPGETLVSVLDQLQFSPNVRPQPVQQPNPGTIPAQSQEVSSAPLDVYSGPTDFKRVSVLRDGRKLGPYDLLALRGAGQPGIALAPDDTIQLVNKPVRVDVGGDVSQPGPVFLYPDDPLIRAIDQVGGVTATSSQTAITLVRGGSTSVVSLGNPVFSAPAASNDRLIVARAPRVDVLGIVVRPGETFLRGNQTLVSAIYYAGGPDRFANLKAVQVLHDGVKTEYNLQRLNKGHEGDNPQLVDGDVVFVPQGSTLDAGIIFQAIASLGFLVYR